MLARATDKSALPGHCKKAAGELGGPNSGKGTWAGEPGFPRFCLPPKEGGVETQPVWGSNRELKWILSSSCDPEGWQRLRKPGSKSSQTAVRAANPGQGSSHAWSPRDLARCCLPEGAIFPFLGIRTRNFQHMSVLRTKQPAHVEKRLRKGLFSPSRLPQVLGGRPLLRCDGSMSHPGETILFKEGALCRLKTAALQQQAPAILGFFHLFLESALLLVIFLT